MANINDLPAKPGMGIMTPLRTYEDMYNELIYAVGRKYPNECRHETALRYIREAEQEDNSTASKEGRTT